MPKEKIFPSWKEQKNTKPDIEDAILEHLDGDMKRIALNFVEYMRENKMPLRWGGTLFTWKATYKSKPICHIRLEAGRPSNQVWGITISVYNIDKYESSIISEGLYDMVWNNLSYHHRCGGNCGHERTTTVFDKEIVVCWGALNVCVGNPGEMEIEGIKKLIELEKNARERK